VPLCQDRAVPIGAADRVIQPGLPQAGNGGIVSHLKFGAMLSGSNAVPASVRSGESEHSCAQVSSRDA
jgi:hypothetical protein